MANNESQETRYDFRIKQMYMHWIIQHASTFFTNGQIVQKINVKNISIDLDCQIYPHYLLTAVNCM